MNDTTVLLAEDNPIIRIGLKSLIDNVSGFHVIGETDTDVWDVARLVVVLDPDVLITDLRMSNPSAQELLGLINQRAKTTRTIVLTDSHDEEDYRFAMRLGVAGYLTKDCDGHTIVEALKAVASGENYVKHIVGRPAHSIEEDLHLPIIGDGYESLTGREREVLKLSAEGKRYSEIGHLLFISPRTAESHRNHLMKKLGLRTMSELIRYAIRNGIVSTEPMKNVVNN